MSGLSCPRPNHPDSPQLPVDFVNWWNKKADSWGICYLHPIHVLKFLSDLMPIEQGRELGLKLRWQVGRPLCYVAPGNGRANSKQSWHPEPGSSEREEGC